MFRLSTTPIIWSTQNCNYSLRYWSYFLCSYFPPTWPSYVIFIGYAVVQLVETLHYKPEGRGSIPDGVIGIFH